jgi:NADH-quinone oxidoreductase subunit C
MMLERVADALARVSGVDIQRPDAAKTGVALDVVVPSTEVRAFAQMLRDLEFLVESVTAVDAAPQMMVLYHLSLTTEPLRVCGRVLIDRAAPTCPSIHDIYPGANWHERETHDFYGITFEGHPDLSPLILPEDAGDLRPLLKKDDKIKALGAVIPRFSTGEEAPAKPAKKAAAAAEEPKGDA